MKQWTIVAVAAALVGVTATAWAFPAEGSASAPGVQHALDVLTHDDGFPGAVARVTDASGRAHTFVSGVGDTDDGAPMPADGHLRMASNVKSMVATVVLQLVGEGKVGLDSSLATYLPGVVPSQAGDANAITIRELLQHTSGLHEYSGSLPSHQSFAPFVHYTRDQLLQYAFATGPDFPPGTQYRYSNTGYILLGMVIEKVTGHPWRDEIAQRIFGPVGMRDSYFPNAYDYGLRGVYAHGYLQLPGAGGEVTEADVTHLDPSSGDANGDGISTPGDLARFYRALFGGQLLPAGLLAEMEKVIAIPSPAGSPELAYGLGVGRYSLPCGGYGWGNAGTTSGFQTISGLTLDGRGEITRAVTIEVNSTFGPQPVEATHFFDVLFAGLCSAH